LARRHDDDEGHVRGCWRILRGPRILPCPEQDLTGAGLMPTFFIPATTPPSLANILLSVEGTESRAFPQRALVGKL